MTRGRRRPFTAAVGLEADVAGEQLAQCVDVAAPRRREEGGCDRQSLLLRNLVSRLVGPQILPGPARELPARRGVAAEGLGNVVETLPEDVVQQERRPLERRQTLQRQQQGQGDIFHRFILDDRVGEPWADIFFPARSRRLQHVQAKPDDGPSKKCCRLLDLVLVDIGPPQPGILDDVFGISQGAQHPVGGPQQHRPGRLECCRGPHGYQPSFGS